MAKVNFGSAKEVMKIQDSETERAIRFLNELIPGKKRKRPIASKAGYCPTANWFSINTEEESFVGGSMKLYQGIGNGVEEEIVKAYERNGVLLGTQVLLPLPEGVDLGGFIDMIALNGSGEPSLYEIKTCTNIPSKIKDEHAAQVAAYWTFSGIKKCYVIYVSRKVQNFPDPTPLIKVFQFDETEEENQIKIDNLFLSLVTSGASLPPARPVTYREKNECVFCNYKSTCWNSGTEFMLNRDFARFSGDAESLKNMALKGRGKRAHNTLLNCLGSCPSENLELLKDFIKEAK